MNEEIKKEADKLMEKGGHVKGEVIRIYGEIIKEKEGEEGVKKIEEKLEELGYPMEFSKIKPLEWKRDGLNVLILLLGKEIFNWTDEDIFSIGEAAPKRSFIIKVLVRYFISPLKLFQNSPKYWRRHYDFGRLEPVEFKEKEATIRINDYEVHPIMCLYFKGYFTSLCKFLISKGEIKIEEVKCVYRGDDCHEYKINWS